MGWLLDLTLLPSAPQTPASLLLPSLEQRVQVSRAESAGAAVVGVSRATYQQVSGGVRVALGCVYIRWCSAVHLLPSAAEWCDR
jgi:hypothetical protein